MENLWERHNETLRQYALPIGLGVIGIVFLLYGLIASVLPKSSKDDIVFESGSEKTATSAASPSATGNITVDIEGAVLKPGVYKLPKDARVQDGLIAAGGLATDADREKVAKGMNLAGKLIDGGKIYIPVVGDSAAVAQGGAGDAGGGVLGQTTNGGLININLASSTELDSLPGIGQVTAGKIIANRPYEKIEDLVSKKAVGQSVFEKIKEKISVY